MMLITLLVVNCLQMGYVHGQTNCYECTDMPHPSECEIATRCSSSEKCYVEQIVTTGGLVLYNSGCKAKTRCSPSGKREILVDTSVHDRRTSVQKRDDIAVCQECCDGDFCNDNGCGQLAQRFPQRGLKCYHCKDSVDLNDCRDLTICQDQSEVCSIHEFVGPDNKPRYQSKCERSFVCKALATLHNNNNKCVTCCDTDFCNHVCNGTGSSSGTGSSGAAITGSHMTPSTTAKTSAATTTTKVTTTQTTTTTVPTTAKLSPQAFCQQDSYLFFGFVPFCFKVHKELQTRTEAQAVCQREQGELAVIDSQMKWDFITKVYSVQMFNGPREFYVDGIYDPAKSTFVCQNGTTCSFLQWGTSQPDNGSSKQCLYLNGADSMKWYNADCSTGKMFICTKSI